MNSTSLVAAAVAASFIVHPSIAADDLLQEVIVTAMPIESATGDLTQPVSVMTGDELRVRVAPSLGETLAQEPGVSSTFYGPAASRPVIRGLGGDRVQVLADGLAALDVSGLSEDHAVAVEPALAEQIEVVRGPATLLYGSGAAGGVVNVVTARLHDERRDDIGGVAEVRGDSALGERAGAGRVDAGLGDFVLHIDGAWRNTDDFSIPGFARSRRLREEVPAAGEEPTEAHGHAPDTGSETKSGGAGLSWIGGHGHLGLAWSGFDSTYGIPLANGAQIEMRQDRLDLDGRIDLGTGLLRALHVRGLVNSYEHAEIGPGCDIGTRFELDGHELRLMLEQATIGGFDGVFGLQWIGIDFGASGEEAFVPGSRTRSLAFYGFEQRDFGRWSVEFGARLERMDIEAEAAAALPDYDGTALSLSAGALLKLGEHHGLALNVTRTERHPTATELYANGPHAATRQFEIGDPGFGRERALTLDLGLRRTEGALRYELAAYLNRYDGYIHLAPAGLVAGGEESLPVFRFAQRDAKFHGFEASIERAIDLGGGTLSLGAAADYVRGRLDGGGDLPRMPPLRAGASLRFDRGAWSVSVDVQHAFRQNDVAAGERPTDGYTMLNADASWSRLAGTKRWLLFLRGHNLLDEDARQHTSPLKDELPLPGRGVAAGIRLEF